MASVAQQGPDVKTNISECLRLCCPANPAGEGRPCYARPAKVALAADESPGPMPEALEGRG
jgi:hypothetical protein